MEPITIKNGWKRVVVSLWLSGDSARYVARNQHQTSRTFKTLAGALAYARRYVAA